METLLRHIQQEWAMIKAAPLAVLITAVLIWAAISVIYRERLDYWKETAETRKLKFSDLSEKEAKESRAAFEKDYKPIVVQGKHFENETVPLDGYDYQNCSFKNVTLEYNGDTPIKLTRNTFDGFKLTSKNPGLTTLVVFLRESGFIQRSMVDERYPLPNVGGNRINTK